MSTKTCRQCNQEKKRQKFPANDNLCFQCSDKNRELKKNGDRDLARVLNFIWKPTQQALEE